MLVVKLHFMCIHVWTLSVVYIMSLDKTRVKLSLQENIALLSVRKLFAY